MEQKAGLFCVGNAMVDLFAVIDGEIPPSWGLSAAVQHITIDRLTEILAALKEAPMAVPGGGAANAARIACSLGVQAVFAGSIGPAGDPYAALFEEGMIRAGVVPCLVRDSSPTGVCLILKKRGGGQVIAACPGAALRFTAEDLPERHIKEAQAVILDGFLLGRDALVRRILDLAVRSGIRPALDAGSVSIASNCAGEIARYCRDYHLIVFMNEEEAGAFCQAILGGGSKGKFPADAGLLKKMTDEEPFPVIVVKRGELGAEVFTRGRIYSAPAVPVLTAETTGAGDAFCAGFMAGWIWGWPPEECAVLGNRAARKTLDSPGVTAGPFLNKA
ncbi:MAG: PfkB family carbohydrate kinase [Treponema sp.]|nr:PfkB family carbohydrate kinase [Treponema sp.]